MLNWFKIVYLYNVIYASYLGLSKLYDLMPSHKPIELLTQSNSRQNKRYFQYCLKQHYERKKDHIKSSSGRLRISLVNV